MKTAVTISFKHISVSPWLKFKSSLVTTLRSSIELRCGASTSSLNSTLASTSPNSKRVKSSNLVWENTSCSSSRSWMIMWSWARDPFLVIHQFATALQTNSKKSQQGENSLMSSWNMFSRNLRTWRPSKTWLKQNEKSQLCLRACKFFRIVHSFLTLKIVKLTFYIFHSMQRFMGINKRANLNDSIKTGERSIWNNKHNKQSSLRGGDASPGHNKRSTFSPSVDASF